ncbi:MAG: hypothetical protein WBI77_11650 [Tepidanaerobacteraceae bacterium]
MDNDKFTGAMDTSTEGLIPPLPIKCDGQPGTLGRVFVVACIDNCCVKSNEVLVVRNT